MDLKNYAQGVFQCKNVWYFLGGLSGMGWDGGFLINLFPNFLPFYAHDGQG